ncbi:GSCOCG00012796001-RA-CDS, partial [Cotesia congregata]
DSQRHRDAVVTVTPSSCRFVIHVLFHLFLLSKCFYIKGNVKYKVKMSTKSSKKSTASS